MKEGFMSAAGYWCDSAPVHISLAYVTNAFLRPGGEGGGGVVSYRLYRYVPRQRVCFL